jgi:uncharacterized protein (DUF488 family)
MELFTIGFKGKTAKQFFNALKKNEIDYLLDVRLNHNQQHYGYAKSDTLKYILEDLMNIKYKHVGALAPTEELKKAYDSKKITWVEYENQYNNLIRGIDAVSFILEDAGNICLLCTEPTAEECHRRLAAEHIKNSFVDVSIKHL